MEVGTELNADCLTTTPKFQVQSQILQKHLNRQTKNDTQIKGKIRLRNNVMYRELEQLRKGTKPQAELGNQGLQYRQENDTLYSVFKV